MQYCTEWKVYEAEENDFFGASPAKDKADYTVKGYMHILAPREGADVRPNSMNSSVVQGGAYIYGSFTTHFSERTLKAGSTIEPIGECCEDWLGFQFVIQDIVVDEVNPFTGWQPTKKYMVACWKG